jgi:coproporphyrinogen III oxidase
MSPITDKNTIAEKYKALQIYITKALEDCDGGAKFIFDEWDRPGGGGGQAGVLTKGNYIEKGGVNFSAVHGQLTAQAQKALHITDGSDFFATGVSIVMHPKNPWIPIIHMNVRYFEINEKVWWFGGGIDLTPHYINDKQAAYFHQKLKEVCDKYNPDWYTDFKNQADDYFYLSHRKETRGIGGIFFDRLGSKQSQDHNQLFNFTQDLCLLFADLYPTLIEKNKSKGFSIQHTEWQRLRRGRYVEFNLIHDRGTRFGLETNGRIESILMSLPPMATWEYNYIPKVGTEEMETLSKLKKGIDWLNME